MPWINLTDEEILTVTLALDALQGEDGEDKATALKFRIEERMKLDPRDQAFAEAVVMAWLWVYNEEAGIKDEDESESCDVCDCTWSLDAMSTIYPDTCKECEARLEVEGATSNKEEEADDEAS